MVASVILVGQSQLLELNSAISFCNNEVIDLLDGPCNTP